MPRRSKNRSHASRARAKDRAHGSGGYSNKKRKSQHLCPNCGKAVTGRSHLCQETDEVVLSRCQYRGQANPDEAGMLEMKYYCAVCDRMTPYRDGVCAPEPL